jgi:hypothetical protein
MAQVPLPCEDKATDLIAGKNSDVGDVYVCEDWPTMTVTYDVSGTSWCLTETKLHVAASADGIPQTKKGNPKPGRFDYRGNHSCDQTANFEIDLPSIGVDLDVDPTVAIAAQAVVEDRSGRQEGAWGGGQRFVERGPSATFFSYTINRAPSAEVLALEMLEDGQLEFELLGSDPEGEAVTFEVLVDVPPEAGSLELTTQGEARFKAARDFYGSTSFTFIVSDGRKLSESARVDINIKPVPDLASARYTYDPESPNGVEVPIPAIGSVIPIIVPVELNKERPFIFTSDEPKGGVRFIPVGSLPLGITLNADGTGSINTFLTGNGAIPFRFTIDGQYGSSDVVTVEASVPTLHFGGSFRPNVEVDACDPLEAGGRYLLEQPGNKATFRIGLDSINDQCFDPTNELVFTVNLHILTGADPNDVVMNLKRGSEVLAEDVASGSELRFTQLDLVVEKTLILEVVKEGDPAVFMFDLELVPSYRKSLRGKLCEAFGSYNPVSYSVSSTDMYLGALCSYAEEKEYAMDVSCDEDECLLNTASGEYSASCFLDGTYRCEISKGGFSAFNCTGVSFNGGPVSGSCFPNLDAPTIISVSVPDGGEYLAGLGNSVTYKGSISTPASRLLHENAVAGTVSQQVVEASLDELYDILFADLKADQDVVDYLGVVKDLDAREALRKILDDVQDESSAAAQVLVLLIPDWILGLAAEPREQLTSHELALVGTAMHHINGRRDQLVSAAKARLDAYFEARKNSCINLSCLYTTAGFPDVLEGAVQDVDAAWVGALLSSAGAGTAAAATVAGVITSATGLGTSLIFPHAATIVVSSTVVGFAALPVAVVAIAAVSTYLAINDLIEASANEEAYNAFIEENSKRLTDLDAFIGRDYSAFTGPSYFSGQDLASERLLGEIFIAGQKVALEVFQ